MRFWLAVSLLSIAAFAQSAAPAQGVHRMEVSVERLDGRTWKAIDSRLVLAADDRIRFKFKSNFDGYLYVTNQSTSGQTEILFPREDTGSANRIEAGREYLVPATHGSFRVTGPEGYDVVSWMVSPVEMAKPPLDAKITGTAEPVTSKPSETLPAQAPLPPGLKPRCDDSIFRARGDCVDTSAGPKVPENDTRSRGLVFIREKKSSVISSPTPLTGPVVYEFRLAHK